MGRLAVPVCATLALHLAVAWIAVRAGDPRRAHKRLVAVTVRDASRPHKKAEPPPPRAPEPPPPRRIARVAPKRSAPTVAPPPAAPATPPPPPQGYSVDTKNTVAESSVAVPAKEGGGNAFADPSLGLPPGGKPSVRPELPAPAERFEAAQWITSAVDRSPPYPAAALRNQIEGQVILRVCVGPSGAVDTVQVVKGLGFGCDEAAAGWAKQRWRFTPAKRGGRAVTTCLLQPMRFQLER